MLGEVIQSAYAFGSWPTRAPAILIETTSTLVYARGGTAPTGNWPIVRVDRSGRKRRCSPAPIRYVAGIAGRHAARNVDERQDRDIWLHSLTRGTLTRRPASRRDLVPVSSRDGRWIPYASATSGPDSLHRSMPTAAARASWCSRAAPISFPADLCLATARFLLPAIDGSGINAADPHVAAAAMRPARYLRWTGRNRRGRHFPGRTLARFHSADSGQLGVMSRRIRVRVQVIKCPSMADFAGVAGRWPRAFLCPPGADPGICTGADALRESRRRQP